MQQGESSVQQAITSILEDVTRDWDLDLEDGIGPSTKLVDDLSFSSIDIIHLVVAIEEHYQRPKMGFEDLLMVDGRYVDDLTVAQLVEFVEQRLQKEAT